MPIPHFRLTLLLAPLMAVASCEHHQEPAAMHPSVATMGQHWMQGKRLEKVMGQIAGLRGAFPKGLPEDAESPEGQASRRALAEMASVANALAEAANTIPGTVENKPMSAADRRGFNAEAQTLHDQATALRNAARSNQIEPLQGMLDGINSTCIACHSRYRDISGDLSTHKASIPKRDSDLTVLVTSRP